MARAHRGVWITLLVYGLFLGGSFLTGYLPGQKAGRDFVYFGWDMLRILPPVFILIGLFEVWVSPEAVQKHCGKDSDWRSYLWAILLAGTCVGGIQMAFPVAYALYKKGARLRMIFTYVGAAAICRIPLTTFEISFLGLKFTLIRWLVSLPLVMVVAVFLERSLDAKGYRICLPQDKK